jgi:hypothetical protein
MTVSLTIAILAIVQVIFDPHLQTRKTVTSLAATAGLEERAFFGHRLAYGHPLCKTRLLIVVT